MRGPPTNPYEEVGAWASAPCSSSARERMGVRVWGCMVARARGPMDVMHRRMSLLMYGCADVWMGV